ncbi:MAG: putative beta-lysine N-acetyltransferase [Desulfuromonas sp.]|nr:putative beta-lysine N-acetyltransferase [Desulfuromonas sp.]
MSSDVVEKIGSSVVQHGQKNDRVYLMKLDTADLPEILPNISNLAVEHNYSKAFVKIPSCAKQLFEENGYRVEAQVPDLFQAADAGHDSEDGLFMARYYADERKVDSAAELVQQVIAVAGQKAAAPKKVALHDTCALQLARPEHCDDMAELYRKTFATYPFPIHDPEYLSATMATNVLYAGIWADSKLLALASAEIDHHNGNAELTDFATDPRWRGHGFASALLQHLETELLPLQIKTGYTIARAPSYGMNICFAQNGYQFGGTLVNNTQISGGLESMNVWHKPLA